MPVGVARPHRDDGQPGPRPVQQLGVLVSRAVVGDLQDVHRRQLRIPLQEGVLRGRFEVAEEQEGQLPGADEKGDAGVVGAALRLGRLPRARRPQHLPGQRTEPTAFTGCRGDDRDTRAARLAVDERGLPGRFFERGALDRPHRPAAQDAGQSVHVIGVVVRQQQERHGPDAQRAETAVDGPGLGSGVHDDGRSVTRCERQGVALSHVAGREPPAGRRPAGDDPGQGSRPDDRQGEEECADRAEPSPSAPTTGQARLGLPLGAPGGSVDRVPGGHDGRGHQRRPRPAARPGELRAGERRAGPRHGRRPGRGPAREPGEAVRHGSGERCGDQGREAQDRGRGDRELREQVAGNADQAHPGRQQHDHRRAGGLRRRGRRQGLRESGRHTTPAQRRAPARGHRQQGAGGQDGQQEPVTPRQPGVIEHQRQDGRRQGGQQGAAAARGEGEQGDQAAGRGPEHARLRPAHHDEPQHQQPAHDRRPPQRDAQPPGQAPAFGPRRQMRGADQQGEQDGQVASGDGEEVSQVRGVERLVEIGRDAGRVPDHQARQQGPRVRRQSVGGLAQARAEPCGGLLEPGRLPDHPRRSVPDADDGRDPVAVVRGRRQPAGHPEPGGRQDAQPVGPDEEQDGRPDLGRGRRPPPGDHDPGRLPLHGDGRGGPHRPADPRPDRPGVLDHRDIERRLRVLRRQPRHRPPPAVRCPQRADHGAGGTAQQHGGGGRGEGRSPAARGAERPGGSGKPEATRCAVRPGWSVGGRLRVGVPVSTGVRGPLRTRRAGGRRRPRPVSGRGSVGACRPLRRVVRRRTLVGPRGCGGCVRVSPSAVARRSVGVLGAGGVRVAARVCGLVSTGQSIGVGQCPGSGCGNRPAGGVRWRGGVRRAGGGSSKWCGPFTAPDGDAGRHGGEEQGHRAQRGDRRRVRRQCGGGSGPGGERRHHQAEVGGDRGRRLGPGRRGVRRVGRGRWQCPPHGCTKGRRSAKRRAPMPLTWRRSVTERKPPC